MPITYLTTILGGFLDICREGKAGVLSDLTGTASTTAEDATVTGTGTKFLTELEEGDTIKIGAITGTVESIGSDTSLELSVAAASTVAATSAYVLGPASETRRPALLDANWDKIADVETFGYQPSVDAETVLAPSETGGYHRKSKLTKSATLDIVATVNDLTELIHELILLSSGAITDDFQPMSGDGSIRGWYRFRGRRQEGGTVVVLMRVWGEISSENLEMGNSVPKPKLTVSVLRNSLNKGSLTLGEA